METAKALAEEVQAEVGTLKSGPTDYFDNFDVEEDIDAVNRQRNFTIPFPLAVDFPTLTILQKYEQQY